MNKYCELVADVASYQPDTADFFKRLADKGVRAVIVKLTEGSAQGTAYVNPKAAKQIKHAKIAGLLVHVYHYAKFRGIKDACDEADWFIQHARKLGITVGSVLVLDIEDEQNSDPATTDANIFLQRVKEAGYPHVDVYSMASWFWSKRLDAKKLIAKNLWVANYRTFKPGVANVGLWQYTNSFEVDGIKLDMSFDFNGFYSKPLATVKKIVDKHSDGFTDNFGDRWFYQHGRFTTDSVIRLRWGARVTSAVISTLPAGSVIQYDAYSLHGGYIWLRQPRPGAKFGYLASGEESGGKRMNCWGKFSSPTPHLLKVPAG